MSELRRLVPYLGRYRRVLVFGMLSLLLGKAAAVAAPQVLRFAVDDLTLSVSTRKLAFYASLIVGISLVEGFFRFWMRRLLIGVSRYIEYDLRGEFFGHLQRMGPSFFHRWRTGDLMSRAANDLSAVRMVLGPGIMYPAETVVITLAALGFMISINAELTLVSLAVMPVVSVAVKVFGAVIHKRFEAIQSKMSDISALAQENLSGMRVVKAYAQEAAEQRKFEQTNQEYFRRNIDLVKVWGAFYPLLAVLVGLGSALVLWWGGQMVVSGAISLGQLVAFFAYLGLLTWPMIAFGWVVNIYQRGGASMKRLAAVFDERPDLTDAPDARWDVDISGHVEFRGVSLRYNGTAVLRNIDLTIRAGQTVAVVGRTGSGKSTLVSLVSRLYDATEGQVLVDGIDVRKLPLGRLRQAVGFVPQESFLFSEKVGENIAFGREEASSEEVVQAASIAGLAGDIADFPAGYDTMVGERGITLSGGQRQRATIARALMTDPRILILDDALSSVDTETEERILSQLRGVIRERTTLLVSHRISTIKDADLIVVLDEGEIVEKGTHDQLLARHGHYASLYRKQLLEEELERI
ncbi:MAG: ABC transporter ATP-binding protein [Acidobacteriota bacterium]